MRSVVSNRPLLTLFSNSELSSLSLYVRLRPKYTLTIPNLSAFRQHVQAVFPFEGPGGQGDEADQELLSWHNESEEAAATGKPPVGKVSLVFATRFSTRLADPS